MLPVGLRIWPVATSCFTTAGCGASGPSFSSPVDCVILFLLLCSWFLCFCFVLGPFLGAFLAFLDRRVEAAPIFEAFLDFLDLFLFFLLDFVDLLLLLLLPSFLVFASALAEVWIPLLASTALSGVDGWCAPPTPSADTATLLTAPSPDVCCTGGTAGGGTVDTAAGGGKGEVAGGSRVRDLDAPQYCCKQ